MKCHKGLTTGNVKLFGLFLLEKILRQLFYHASIAMKGATSTPEEIQAARQARDGVYLEWWSSATLKFLQQIDARYFMHSV